MTTGSYGNQLKTLTLFIAVLAGCSEELRLGEEQSDSNEAEITAEMIDVIKTISLDRAQGGLVKRVNQGKTVACLNGSFQIMDNLPDRLRHGLFSQPRTYQAMARFANASEEDDRESDFHGMSIKVFGVEGEKLWGTEKNEQDFLFNSYPALFAANNSEFLSFLKATGDDAMWRFFVNPLNWDSAMILIRGRDEISSVFDIPFWSTTPYRLGSDDSVAVKYSVKPCSTYTTDASIESHEDFLRDSIEDHLGQTEACYDFGVQFQLNAEEMPIENAAIIWDESDSPFETVARFTISQQDFLSEEALAQCEAVTFNPWQSLPEHRPIGGINRVRRAVYSEAGQFRNQQNQNLE